MTRKIKRGELKKLIKEEIKLIREARNDHQEVDSVIETVLDPGYLAESIWESIGDEDIEPSEHVGSADDLEKAIASGLKSAIKTAKALHAKTVKGKK
jgi:hypothetical protein